MNERLLSAEAMLASLMAQAEGRGVDLVTLRAGRGIEPGGGATGAGVVGAG